MSCETKIIELPVSIGEGIDKLTILAIKKRKLIDQSLIECSKEYDLLWNKLGDIVTKYQFFYDRLLEVNLMIWEKQDEFRDLTLKGEKSNHLTDLCTEIIVENDNRFRLKSKINRLSNSYISEQKGYTQRKAFVLSHLGLGDMINCIGAIRYLSTKYDEVKVVCKWGYLTNAKQFYEDDPTITFFPVTGDHEISVPYGCPAEVYLAATRGYDVYKCGFHNQTPIVQIPLSFYLDFGIDPKIRTKYFYIPERLESSQLLSKVLEVTPKYRFVHQSASTGTMNFGLDPSDMLTIDSNQNFYQVGHPYYSLCESLRNLNITDYVDLVRNAEELYMVDSAFFCLAIHLDLSKVKTKKVYSRCGNDYSYLSTDFQPIT